MPVPLICDWCHEGRYQVRAADTYACQACGNQSTRAALPVGDHERLVTAAGILQILDVPDGHQVITPDRRCYAPHLGASLTLALRLHRARRTVFSRPEEAEAADLPALLDADESGPWVLSPLQLGALTRAMDVRSAALPSAARQHPEFDAEVRKAHADSQRLPTND
ncbi:hypothetical protein ACFRIC_38870 [Streptomyces sp. NPDC056738]|uniref:hypothetical protein n=1 Tax=Streptomyces sp. NPDC056738 TaxID=3345933 RepID=UPI00369A4F6C